jgi:hypothetical protein
MTTKTSGNIFPKLYGDRFDTSQVSNLSLFLFKQVYLLLAKDLNGIVIAAHHIEAETNEDLITQLDQDELLGLMAPLRVFNFTSGFCLVPGLFFDPLLRPAYLFFADSDEAEKNLLFDTGLESNNIHLISSIDQNLANLFQKKGLETCFHHGSATFLAFALREKNNLINQEILVNVYEGFFFVAAFSNQELVLFNSFEMTGNRDLLKYLFGLITQLGFNQLLCRVSAYGNLEAYDIDEDWGKAYFKNFRIALPYLNQQYLKELSDYPNSRYFDTFWEFQ